MSERNMEGEDSVRTVDCLRGRLLAERAASRNAKEEAHLLENKLMELEKLLKQEAKSRKRAEKKLKFLTKKLESINVSSDESQHSELIDKTDISSISSKEQNQQQEESNRNHEIQTSEGLETQESKGGAKSQKGSRNLEQIDSQNSSFSLSSDYTTTTPEGTSIPSAFEALLPELEGLECPRKSKTFEDSLSEQSSSNMDQQSELCCLSIRSSADEEEEEGHDSNSQVDNSMALVLFNTPQKVDPNALHHDHDHDHDHAVREALDSLKRAKDELRSSMQRRRMNVMMANLTIKTSYHFHIA